MCQITTMFSSRSFMVSFYLVSFCGMWQSYFPNTIYHKDYPFPIAYVWLLCQKLIDLVFAGLFLDALLFHWAIHLFLCQYHCFNYCRFIIHSEITEYYSSAFVLSRLLGLFGVFFKVFILITINCMYYTGFKCTK